jgi:hypothetical protein
MKVLLLGTQHSLPLKNVVLNVKNKKIEVEIILNIHFCSISSRCAIDP